MKRRSFSSVLLLLIGLVLSIPTLARADHPPELDQVMTLLLQAQDASSGSISSINGPDLEAILQSAKNILHGLQGGSIYKGHKIKAEREVSDAISALKKQGRGPEVDEHIRNGVEEVRTCINNFDAKPLAPERHETRASPTGPVPVAPVYYDAPTLKLTAEQDRAVVAIKGDNGEGTGFLVKMPDGPVVVTSLRVLANNPNLKATDNSGAEIKILSVKGAADRDIALLSVQDAGFSYLDLANDIATTVQPGDFIVTSGNSTGGEVILNTAGRVIGVGADRIEIDNPIYHGNRGAPVFHAGSGKVVGVVGEALKPTASSDLDKEAFLSRDVALPDSARYFGLRIDTVKSWVPIDWNRFQVETAFLDRFRFRSRCLDSYLNSPESYDSNRGVQITGDASDINLWRKDDKIVKANDNFFQLMASAADKFQRADALQQFSNDLLDVANSDMDGIQNANNFYSFDQIRAKDETNYRKALVAELNSIGADADKLGSKARKSD